MVKLSRTLNQLVSILQRFQKRCVLRQIFLEQEIPDVHTTTVFCFSADVFLRQEKDQHHLTKQKVTLNTWRNLNCLSGIAQLQP